MDTRNFYAGEDFFTHLYLGAHLTPQGTVFRTFAPAADRIELRVNGNSLPMNKVLDGNFWELEVAGVHEGDAYEYRIFHNGFFVDHSDPYGYQMELRPNHRSIVCDLSHHQFKDQKWMEARKNRDTTTEPMNIYELNLGSWHKRSGDQESEDPADWYSYAEIAKPLAKYLKETGYNYVEFMPLNEYPFDGSWGYQPTGFFAPTSRFGTPEQLMQLVDTLHQAGIGCILDIVPVHFATDVYGLADYDGTALFEYPNSAVGVSEWGSHNFMYSRGESCSFMQSSANYWLGAYHFDGLRMDAISRIIYWQGDESRGINNENVTFIKRLNAGAKSLNPGTFTVAEDSTDYKGTTKPVEQGGLGFDYKWDMGWMHDTLDFFQTGPEYRSQNYHKLSFSMMYFHNERYLLPLSHDENVHGKATIAQKMSGDYELKFPQARCLYLYMLTHPGKKLNFMGSEIAQLREWDENREQDWFLRKYPQHDSFYHYCKDLNKLYLKNPALWQLDYEEMGFEWREVDDTQNVVYAYERRDAAQERLLVVLNLSDQQRDDYVVRVPNRGKAKLLLYTDWQRYSGNTPDNTATYSLNSASGGTLTCSLAPFSGIMLKL